MKLTDYLDSENIAYTELPEGLSVGGPLDLEGTQITELPEGLSVGGSLYLRGTQITELPEGLSVGGSLDFNPENQLNSISAYRNNCGRQSRTIYAVLIGGLIKVRAGCFFGDLSEFIERVNNEYQGDSASQYILSMTECVNEVMEKTAK